MSDPSEIGRLLARYADIATRQAWDEYADIVLPDARVHFAFSADGGTEIEVTGPAGLAGLGAAAMDAFSFYLYVPLNSVADVDGDTATGRAYALESMVDLAGTWVDVYGAYDDDYARVDGRWMIAGRRYRELRRVER